MDVIVLSRMLFAVTAGIHYLFVATTLGLAPVIAVGSTVALLRRSARLERLLAAVGRVYLANYATGIVTGLVMELQMAVLWTGPGALEYDPIAAMLALETVLAFFLESVLLGLWVAGRGQLPRWVLAALFWGVTATAYLSATFIIGANSQLHAPIDLSGTFEAADVAALILRGAALSPLLHVVSSSLVVGGFWLAAIAVRWLRGGGDEAVARAALRAGAVIVALAAPTTIVSGIAQFSLVRPDLPIGQGIGIVGLALAVMMLVGMLILLGTWLLVLPAALVGSPVRWRWTWPVFSFGVLIPLATTFLGWLYREEARQPWFIVGRVTVQEAASPLPLPQLLTMSIVFVGLSALAAVCGGVMMNRVAAPRPPAPAEPGRLVLEWA